MKNIVIALFCIMGASTSMANNAAQEVQLDDLTIDMIDRVCAPQTNQGTCAGYLNELLDMNGNKMTPERVSRLVGQVKQRRVLRLNKNIQVDSLANELVK